MIRGNHLDRPVGDGLPQGFAVFTSAQRRIHLETTVLLQILVAEQQVVRRRFAADFQPGGLRPANRSTLSLVETWQT